MVSFDIDGVWEVCIIGKMGIFVLLWDMNVFISVICELLESYEVRGMFGVMGRELCWVRFDYC